MHTLIDAGRVNGFNSRLREEATAGGFLQRLRRTAVSTHASVRRRREFD